MVYKHSQEIKDKLREMNLGENNPMFNKTHTEEAKEKIRKANTGENNPMYDKVHSEETKLKISNTLKDRKKS